VTEGKDKPGCRPDPWDVLTGLFGAAVVVLAVIGALTVWTWICG
jgi:hypothetical protein